MIKIETDLGLKQNTASNPLGIKPFGFISPLYFQTSINLFINPNLLIQVNVYKGFKF